MSEDKILGQGKWLKLIERSSAGEAGNMRRWEFASRTNASKTVCMIAAVRGPEPSIVLVKQYRVPIAAWIVELPAGLIDDGETAQIAALRELAEETGYSGDVASVGPFAFNSPGMSDESVACVRVNCLSKAEPSHSSDEQIEVEVVPIAGLSQKLREIEASGTRVDAKLWCFAEGLELLH